jgi:hypothetical protein
MSSTWYVDRTPDGDNEGTYDNEQAERESARCAGCGKPLVGPYGPSELPPPYCSFDCRAAHVARMRGWS